MPNAEDAASRRAERAAQADYHVEQQRIRRDQEAAQAQEILDRFVAEATAAGLATEELTARPWSGRGRYRTGITGWRLRRDGSVGVGADGAYYELNVPPVLLGRWRTVPVKPSAPPLEVGKGARDGESFPLATLTAMRLAWEAD